MEKEFRVYLLECKDGTYYCGITSNLAKRISDHNAGKGAKYTRGRGPFKVLAVSNYYTKSEALSIEHSIKKLRKSQKVNALLKL